MRVLVTWGSKRGGTEGLARMVADALRDEGLEVDALPPAEAARAAKTVRYDGVVVGGGIYANRWHHAARSFVARTERRLRALPVWFFSSGPLDDSAERAPIPPTAQVEVLMERVGAQGHVTFGGTLAPDARGFPASAMAKEHAGDWRSPDAVRAWAHEIALALPGARPGPVVPQPARSIPRLIGYGALGWAVCAVVMAALLSATGLGAAVWIRALVAPFAFAAVARRYFAGHGARDALPAAAAFAAEVIAFDLALTLLFGRLGYALFSHVQGTWLVAALAFLVTWGVGELVSTMPWPPARRPPGAERAPR